MGKMRRAEETKKAKKEALKKGKSAPKPRMEVISESGVTTQEESFIASGTGVGDGSVADKPGMPEPEISLSLSSPAALTLPLLTDNATLFLQGAAQLVADTLGKPECAPLLVRLNDWIDGLTKLKKLIVGNEDAIEGLKAKVISDGEPWGENGSKQLTLAGAQVRVKAVNYRAPDAALTIADLDASKVEAYIRANAVDAEKTLPGYMKAITKWSLTDLSPLQQKNLTAMLADPGEWGQGLRQCVKDTKYQMMAPEMAVES